MPKIQFPVQMFRGTAEQKVSFMLPDQMVKAIDQLSEALGFKDRSKTIRWCLEQILKEAIDQGQIKLSHPNQPITNKVG